MSFVELSSLDVVEGQLFSTKVQGEPVILTRVQGEVKAYSAKCPHMGMSLSTGKLEQGVLTCRFHGAAFDVATGNNVKWVDSFVGIPLPKFSHKILAMGKSPCGLKHYKAVEQDNKITVSVI